MISYPQDQSITPQPVTSLPLFLIFLKAISQACLRIINCSDEHCQLQHTRHKDIVRRLLRDCLLYDGEKLAIQTALSHLDGGPFTRENTLGRLPRAREKKCPHLPEWKREEMRMPHTRELRRAPAM